MLKYSKPRSKYPHFYRDRHKITDVSLKQTGISKRFGQMLSFAPVSNKNRYTFKTILKLLAVLSGEILQKHVRKVHILGKVLAYHLAKSPQRNSIYNLYVAS